MTKTAAAKRKRAEREALKAEPSHKRPKSDHPRDSFEPKLFVENPTGADRVREAKLYELLGSEDTEDRVAAAVAVVSSLLGDGGGGVPEPVLERHLDKRLFRGLASGRAGARLGYSIVISEVLLQLFGDEDLGVSTYPGLTFERVLEALQERTKPGGNMTGQEERDHYFGQLFGLECIVRADLVRRDPARWKAVLEPLIKLAAKKVWLRSQCGWVIAQALSIGSLDEKLAHMTIENLKTAGWAITPEYVAITLVALDMYPDLEDKGVRNPLDHKNLDLPAILKESAKGDAGEDAEEEQKEADGLVDGKSKKKQAIWTHQLHFVWSSIIAHYIPRGEDGAKDFAAFWKRAVDDNLFSKTATEGQKLRGFLVMQEVLSAPALDNPSYAVSVVAHCDWLFPVVFSKNLMACLVNQATHEDRHLHRMAIKTLALVEDTAAQHPDLAGILIENLTGNNGVYSFDVRTGTKAVETILRQSKPEMGEDLIGVLSAPVMKTCTRGKDLDKVKLDLRVYVEYLFKLSNSAPEPVLKELTSLAYANPIWIPKNASDFVKSLSRERLQSVFANLCKRGDDSTHLCFAIEAISPDYIQMDSELKKAVLEARKRLKSLMRQISKEQTKDATATDQSTEARWLALLYAIAIFQLYNAEPDAFQLLGDLKEYEMRSSSDEEGAAEFLVETLLSMVSQSSVLLRQVSQQVFGYFTKRATPKALDLLLDVLSADESTQGQQALFNVETDDVDPDDLEEEEDDDEDDDVEEIEEDDLDSDMEIGSDVEFVTFNGDGMDKLEDDEEEVNEEDDSSAEDDDETNNNKSNNKNNEDESSDEEDEEEDQDPEQAAQLEALDDALGKILNTNRVDKDKDADDDSDSDMTDSEMIAMDDALAAVFKERVKNKPSGKRQRKEAKESVVNFKRRVLDLLETYVRNEAGAPPALAVLLPLLRLARVTSVKSLADRALHIVREYQRRLKKARAAADKDGEEEKELDVAATLQLLRDIHAEAASTGEARDVERAAASASLIVASTLFIADEASRPAVEGEFEKMEGAGAAGAKTKKGKGGGRGKKRRKNQGADVDMGREFRNWKLSYETNKRGG